MNSRNDAGKGRYRSFLLFGRRGGGVPAGRSVCRASTSRVVVGAAVIVGVIVRAIAVGIVITTAPAGVGTSRCVVAVALTIGS